MDFILDITYISYIITACLFFLFKKNLKNKHAIIILVYTLYSFVNDIVIERQLITSLPSTFLLSLFTIIEFIFLFFYIFSLLTNRKFKIFLLICSFVFLFVAVVNFYKNIVVGTPSFDTIPIAVSSITLISGSIFYLFETIQKPEISFVYSRPNFWVVVGIMIYFSGTFFLFLQFDSLSPTDQVNFWIINLICFVLKNIFFSISFTLKPENQQSLNVDEFYLNKLE